MHLSPALQPYFRISSDKHFVLWSDNRARGMPRTQVLSTLFGAVHCNNSICQYTATIAYVLPFWNKITILSIADVNASLQETRSAWVITPEVFGRGPSSLLRNPMRGAQNSTSTWTPLRRPKVRRNCSVDPLIWSAIRSLYCTVHMYGT